MAGAVVQSKLGENATAGTTLASGSFVSNVTSGNYLWVVTNSGDSSTVTITKNSGTATIGTVTEQGNSQEAGTLETLRHFTIPITGTGSLDLLATFGTSRDNRSILAHEISGVDAVLGQTTGTDTGENPTTTMTVNVTTQPAFGLAHGCDVQGGTYGVGTGWTNVGTFGASVHNIRVQRKAITSTGNTTANFTNAGLDRGVYCMVVFQDAASGVSGTLARTNANDTLSANGTTTVTGSLAKTNVNDTSSATGTTTIVGSLAKTNANDTSVISGSVGEPVSGTLATTNANDTSAATGTTTIRGTVAKTNVNDTSAAQGTTTVLGAVAKTNVNDTLSANGSVGSAVGGSLAVTNVNDTLVSSGTTTIVSSLAKTNLNDTSSASGTTTVTGTLSKTNSNDTLAASGASGTPPLGIGTKIPLTGAGGS